MACTICGTVRDFEWVLASAHSRFSCPSLTGTKSSFGRSLLSSSTLSYLQSPSISNAPLAGAGVTCNGRAISPSMIQRHFCLKVLALTLLRELKADAYGVCRSGAVWSQSYTAALHADGMHRACPRDIILRMEFPIASSGQSEHSSQSRQG